MTRARTTSPMIRNQRRKSSEVPSEVKIRKVVPEVPRNEIEQGELLEDLQTMGCSRLLKKPWDFKDDRIVRSCWTGCRTSSTTQFERHQPGGRRSAGGRYTISAREVADWQAGRTSTSKIVSKSCQAPRMDMPLRTARIRSIGVCSRILSRSYIRRSRTG
jgi:hypothetical protein